MSSRFEEHLTALAVESVSGGEVSVDLASRLLPSCAHESLSGVPALNGRPMQHFLSIRGSRAIFLVALALLVGDTVRADGPWIEKSYGEWDRGDVRRILFDSPWVRHFTRTRRALE